MLTIAAVAAGARLRRSAGSRWRRRTAAALLVAVSAAAVVCGIVGGWFVWFTHRPQPAPERRAWSRGLTYVRDVRRVPRPVVAHVVTIDLTTPGLRFVVTPGEPGAGPDGRTMAARTVSGFLGEFHCRVAINANYFRPFHSKGPWDYYPHAGDGVDVLGVAAAGGTVYAAKPWHDGTLYLSNDPAAGYRATFDPPENGTAGIDCAVSGNGYLLRRGAFAGDVYPDSPDAVGGRDARAAVALDRAGRTMLLFVVDGKQPNYSEGMTQRELADLIRAYGGDTAVRLDEGGSAALAAADAAGNPRVLSCPIHTRIPHTERPVANHLGIIVPPN